MKNYPTDNMSPDDMQMVEVIQKRINALYDDGIARRRKGEPSSPGELLTNHNRQTVRRWRWFRSRVEVVVEPHLWSAQLLPLTGDSKLMGPKQAVLLDDWREHCVVVQDTWEPFYRELDLAMLQQQHPAEFEKLRLLLDDICRHRHLMEFA